MNPFRWWCKQPRSAIRTALLAIGAGAALVVSGTEARQDEAKHFALESTDGLQLHNVTAEPAVLQGRKGLRVTLSEETARRLPGMSPEEQQQLQQLARIEGLEFDNGLIEAEIAGAPRPGAAEGARGFVGVAFRLQNDMKTVRCVLPSAHERARRRSRATQSCRSIHLASRLAVVPASQGDAVEI